jgi:hypothetical protein
MAMMAITTSSSISVKGFFRPGEGAEQGSGKSFMVYSFMSERLKLQNFSKSPNAPWGVLYVVTSL